MITLTKEEAQDIINFIGYTLDREWDRYTDIYICQGTSWEDGKRRMDPKMYDFMQELDNRINNIE